MSGESLGKSFKSTQMRSLLRQFDGVWHSDQGRMHVDQKNQIDNE